MPKVVVLPLSMYVDVQQQKAIDAFSKLGVSKWRMLWNWSTLNQIFNRYKCGETTTAAFRNEIRHLFPDVDFPKNAFDANWNVMCDITESGRERLKEVAALIKQGIEVFFISSTNPLHVQHIEGLYGERLPGVSYFSYEKGWLGSDLYDELFSELQQKNSRSEDVVIFYEPPKTKLGFSAWCHAPFKKWFDNQTHSFISALSQLAATSAFTLEACQLSKYGALTKALKEMGWLLETKPVIDASPTYTPARKRLSDRYSLRQSPVVIDLTKDSQIVKTQYT